ncbi:MAG: SDR family NAD(P)-dependent oxidoreductase [Bacteroidia bacterium]
MKLSNKVMVVTGAGSGIGRELVLQLLAKNSLVVMVDINEVALQETAALSRKNEDCYMIFKLDVSDKEKVYELPEKVIEKFNRVDGLINNAGIIQPFIPVNELDYDKIFRIMNINFYGTLYLTKAFLPFFLKLPEAHIANVCSMGGFIPFPGQTFYGASKAAVKLLTEGLASELMNTNVHVTLIYPGGVSTNIMKNSGVQLPATENNKNYKALSASKAASLIIEAIEKNKQRVCIGSDSVMMDKLYRIAPTWASRFIAKQMGKAIK